MLIIRGKTAPYGRGSDDGRGSDACIQSPVMFH